MDGIGHTMAAVTAAIAFFTVDFCHVGGSVPAILRAVCVHRIGPAIFNGVYYTCVLIIPVGMLVIAVLIDAQLLLTLDCM